MMSSQLYTEDAQNAVAGIEYYLEDTHMMRIP